MLNVEKLLKQVSIVFDDTNCIASLESSSSVDVTEFIGKNMTEIFPCSTYDEISEIAVEAIVKERKITNEVKLNDQNIFDVSIEPVSEGLALTSKSIHHRLKHVRMKVDYNGLLNDIAGVIGQDVDCQTTLDSIAKLIVNHLELDTFLLALRDKSKTQMRVKSLYLHQQWIQNYGPMTKGYRQWFDRVIGDKNYLKIYDTSEIDDVFIRENCRQFGMASMMTIPIMLRNDIEGFIIFSRNYVSHWDNHETHFLHAISITLSQLVKNQLTKEILQLEEKKFSVALEAINEGVVIVDSKGTIEFINGFAQEILESDVPDALLSSCAYYELDDQQVSFDLIQHLVEHRKKRLWGTPFILKTKAHMKVVDCCASPIVDDNDVLIGGIILIWDMTEKIELDNQLEYLSKHDKMTGLYNRGYFETILNNPDLVFPICLLIGDLNGLKITNDAYGHEVGDQLLKESGQYLLHAIDGQGKACRWGGDEFLVLIEDADETKAFDIFNKAKAIFSESKGLLNKHSISLGYAFAETSEAIEKCLKDAEDYMYKRKFLESKSFRNSIIRTMQQTLHEKSHETEMHAQRLVNLSRELALALHLTSKEISDLELAAVLHDIGKISINNDILEKTGPLTDDEWVVLKTHAESGYRILKSIPELSHVAEFVLSHHERWDGSGYPRGLKKKEIPLLSRIISIVDAYDAMTETRIYRQAISSDDAVEEIIACSGRQFDPEIVAVFVDIMSKKNLS